MNIKSSLSKHISKPSTTLTELRSKGKAAWHKPGELDDAWGCTRIGDIQSWDVKMIFIQEFERQYGKRGS